MMDLSAGIVILRQGYWASLYIYIKGRWEVWGISQNSIDIDATMTGCGVRERESCGAVDQRHRSLNWGIWEKEWPAFSCDLRSSVCGIGFDFSALVTNRSKSEKQPEMWPWNNTTHIHSDSHRQFSMIFQTLCQGCPFSIYRSIFFFSCTFLHGALWWPVIHTNCWSST